MSLFMNWIDFLWIGVALLLAKGRYKAYSVIFVFVSILMLRLQVKLMQEIGFGNGILQWIDTPVLFRGMMAYGVFIAAFLGLVSLSKDENAYVFIAASITIFTIAFCVSSAVMVL
ncbi:MAG: hypothetical protein CMH31_01535 [Micavibrio sp.]|nr:hypothetical protein [Micavibrio sp.]|tara:strand:- start:69 stop:413 length:345 start_codon:yes stop_codon:yes gene_type:complete